MAQTATPKQREGTIVIGPNGDKRIRLKDVARPQQKLSENEVQIKLKDIVLGTVRVEIGDNPVLVFPPVNIKAYAALEARYGSLEDAVNAASGKRQYTELVAMITILVNSELPKDQEIPEDLVARSIPVEYLPIIDSVIEELFRPLLSAATPTPLNQAEAHGGAESSTSLPESSDGDPMKSPA